jgi:hypothetical protein
VAWAINALTAPTTYSAASTLDNLPFAPSINIDVANAAIYWQVKQANSPSGLHTEGTWQEETFMLPGSRSIYRSGLRGFRFRAASSSASPQAVVTAEAVT